MLPTGLAAQLACIWEATARKPGNVHRYCDFEDVTYLDFIASAAAVGPVLERATDCCVGQTVLDGVRATRLVARTNTNLGMLLLLAPLAAVPREQSLRAGVRQVLDRLDVEDARLAYEAIRLAVPGGLGRVSDQDVRHEPTATLREVMMLAADRDLVARQYAGGFEEVFGTGVPALELALARFGAWEPAIIQCHLHLMAAFPDTLIARKRGRAEAEESAARARRALEHGGAALAELDAWLRAEGHARNPGTTADLVTACLFALLREGTIQAPSSIPWSAGAGHA